MDMHKEKVLVSNMLKLSDQLVVRSIPSFASNEVSVKGLLRCYAVTDPSLAYFTIDYWTFVLIQVT